jgi:rhamnosyltransferase
MITPRVSICLPTYNGARDLVRLLPALAAQRLDDRQPGLASGVIELCVIDSSSTDESVALLRAAGAPVEVIPKSEFRHGATRNRIAAGARGEILVFLSQDALPLGERFIADLIAPFEDPRTAGVCARVLPHPEDDPLTRRTVLAQPEAEERAICFDLDGVDGLWSVPESKRLGLLAINDVASAIRASVFRAIPFPDVSFGEDVAWAARALTAGWRLRSAPAAIVQHAHRYSARQAFERYRVDAHFRRHVLGHTIRPSLISVARGISYEVYEDLRYLAGESQPGRVAGLLRSPFLRSAQVLGQYFGAHAAR